MKKKLFILVLGYTLSLDVAAQEPSKEKLVATCVACHGMQGISSNPQWPNLASQHANYLAKQLRNFKETDVRPSDIMRSIAAELNEQDIINIALYYSLLPIPSAQRPQPRSKRGEELYRNGDFKQHIPACIACHGPRGTGNKQAGFPLLSGQHSEYTVLQLTAFKLKRRNNDIHGIMRDISKRMTKDDMVAVAEYIATLH
ncbi:MAG: c-type cytochrome [Legionella sp.]